MKAFSQNLSDYRFVYIIRAGAAAAAYGDPWDHVVVAASQDGVTAVLMGFRAREGDPVRAIATAAVRLLKGMGYERVVWERIENGESRWVDATRK